MKVLVTGGAGFIGSHLVDALIAEGHQVEVLDDLSGGFRENVPTDVPLHVHDIGAPEVRTLFADARYEAVFHLAAQMDVRKSVEDPSFDAQVNVLGSLNLLEASVRTGVGRFIFASSGGAGYGEQDYYPADEAHPIQPLSPYGITKVTVERYLYYYEQVKGLRYVSLRYANVYGPRQNPHGEAGVVAIFAQRIRRNEPVFVFGDGEQTRDFVFVADVVQANLKALAYGGSGCFNVGTGIETSVNQIFDFVNAYNGNPTVRQHKPAKAGEQRRSVLNAALIQQTLNWTPQYDFATGMRATLEWFAANS
jgi:UDP-glucose 4-epimerase